MAGQALPYELIDGQLHRHGALRHSHPHTGPHTHEPEPHHHDHSHSHGHSHGLVDASIKRSREGIRAVALSLLVLGITAVILKITWDSWRTVRGHAHHHHH
jgi:hypothetical protein